MSEQKKFTDNEFYNSKISESINYLENGSDLDKLNRSIEELRKYKFPTIVEPLHLVLARKGSSIDKSLLRSIYSILESLGDRKENLAVLNRISEIERNIGKLQSKLRSRTSSQVPIYDEEDNIPQSIHDSRPRWSGNLIGWSEELGPDLSDEEVAENESVRRAIMEDEGIIANLKSMLRFSEK